MVKVVASCYLASTRSGTNLSHFDMPISCEHCGEKYLIAYSAVEAASIAEYERKVREAAQAKINKDHPPSFGIDARPHTTHIPIEYISN